MSPSARALLRTVFRALFALACAVVLIRSARIGVADSLVRSGQPAAIAQAIAMEPRNDAWVAKRAILLFEGGDSSEAVESELANSLARRPDDSGVRMALGLLYEQRGNQAEAEKLLLGAVAVDRRFTPSWTLANFYFRAGQFDKMWPSLRACLALIEPQHRETSDFDIASFDPAPVYALAWQASGDAKFILNLLPRKRETLVPYLAFLNAHPELPFRGQSQSPEEFAGGVWPEVIQVAQAPDEPILMTFLDHALQSTSPAVAVRAWNDLIDRRLLPAVLPEFGPENRLDPRGGKSIADAGFETTAFEHGFGWRIPYTPGIIRTATPHLLALQFTGTEPERFPALSTYAPVLRGRTYRVHWILGNQAIQGLVTELKTGDAAETIRCNGADCEFKVPEGASPEGMSSPEGISMLELALTYRRPPGTVRLRDTLLLKGVRLELQK